MADFPWVKSYPDGVKWEIDIPRKPIYALLDEAVAKWPDNPAIDFMDKKITYRELGDMVHRAAKGLQELGVGPGVHVGLFLPNTPHYVISFFAILKAGGIVVNYSPLDAERELVHKISDSRTQMMITLDLELLYPRIGGILASSGLSKIIVGNLPEVLPFPKNLLYPIAKRKDVASVPSDEHHVSFKSLLDNDGDYVPHPIENPDEAVAVLQYTGGTTGVPKGAMLTHYNLVAAREQYMAFQEGAGSAKLDPGVERFMGVLPLFHIYALTVVMTFGIGLGAELILHPRFELDAVVKDIAKKRPTVLPGVPTMYMAIAAEAEKRKLDVSSLKFCASGGAPLPLEIQRKFEKVTGTRLLEGWGMTETSPSGTSTPNTGKVVEGAAGVPLPGIDIRIIDVDDPSRAIPQGETGEITIKGPNVMKGYWNKPEETKTAFIDGYFRTGDTGFIDEDGYLHIVDRVKDMITSGGFNVYPRIVEEAIHEHPSVSEVTVIGIPDDYRGEAAKAFIKLADGAAEFSLEDLKAFLSDKLGKHEMPAAVEFRDELPKTPIGKLSKKELVAEEKAKREVAQAAS